MLESYMFKRFLRFRISLCLLFFFSFKKIDDPGSLFFNIFMTLKSERLLIFFLKSRFSMSDKLF